MTKRIIITILFVGLFLPSVPVFGSEPAKTADASAKAGQNCLFIGHSFFVPVAKRFEALPGRSGIETHRQQTVFSGGASGSPGSLWKGGKRTQIQKILATGEIELLGMTYYDSTNSAFEDYQRWIDYALKHNAGTTFFIGQPWGKNGASRALKEYTAANSRTSESLQKTVTALRKSYPENRILFLNYGRASVELKRLFETGALPGVKGIVGKSGATIYSDRLGHGTNILKDLSALLWLTDLYDIDLAASGLKLDYAVDLKAIASEIVAAE
jgi:hypothetical protein